MKKHKQLDPVKRISKLERDVNDLSERVCVESEKFNELDESVLHEIDVLHNHLNVLRKKEKFNKILLIAAIIVAIIL